MSAGKVFGIIGIVLSVIILLVAAGLGGFYGYARSKCKVDGSQAMETLDLYTVGGGTANRVVGSYDSTDEVNIYLTHSPDTTSFFSEMISRDPDVNGTRGSFDLDGEGQTCYLMVVAGGDLVFNYDVDFQSDTLTNICLIPALIVGIVGILILIGSIMLVRRSRKAATATGALAQSSPAVPNQQQAPGQQNVSATDQSISGSARTALPSEKKDPSLSGTTAGTASNGPPCPDCGKPSARDVAGWFCPDCKRYLD